MQHTGIFVGLYLFYYTTKKAINQQFRKIIAWAPAAEHKKARRIPPGGVLINQGSP
jgi:hypothetical protein